MILYVTDREIKESNDVKVIQTALFNAKTFHPFIATAKWDKVIVDITDKIKTGYIKQLIGVDFIVEPIMHPDTDVSNYKIISLVSEAIPSASRELRLALIKKEDMRSKLEEVGVKFV